MCHIGQYSVFCGQWASHHKSTPRPLIVDTLQIRGCLKMIHHQNFLLRKNKHCCNLQRPVTSGTFLSFTLLFPFLIRFLTLLGVLCSSLMSNNNICQFLMRFPTMNHNDLSACGRFQEFVTVMFCFVTHCLCHVNSSSLCPGMGRRLKQKESDTSIIFAEQIYRFCSISILQCKLTNLFSRVRHKQFVMCGGVT